jgi:hypothetical protein
MDPTDDGSAHATEKREEEIASSLAAFAFAAFVFANFAAGGCDVRVDDSTKRVGAGNRLVWRLAEKQCRRAHLFMGDRLHGRVRKICRGQHHVAEQGPSARSSPRRSTGDGILSGLVSLSASYRFTEHWAARVTWNRVVTRYSRDTDVLLGGVGYRF